MKTALLIAALAASACRAPNEAPTPKPPVPTAAPMEPNRAEKYVSGLQADVKRAREAKEKLDAANKKTDESQKELQQAEGQ